ncbi:MAG TPA: peptidase MA family metallohydrolase [Chloroflexia bacterium]|nr:peptidase MA family metallohydrolase [Chloroflexia bacterium]
MLLLADIILIAPHSFAQSHSSLVTQSSVLGPHYSFSVLSPHPSLLVESQTAEADFPSSVEFRLKASGFETARAELNYRLVGDSVTAGMQAEVEEVTAAPDLGVTLDLTTDYLPPGSQVEYYWTLTDPLGNTTETPTQAFKLVDERYSWKSLTDAQGRVTLHWYEGGSGFGKTLLGVAKGALDRLQNDIDAGLTRPAEVWVYASQDELLDALPANIPEWVGGKAFPHLALVMASIADDNMAELETKRTIPHELSHLVLYQATRNPYNAPPAWLDEGLAVYNQEAHDPAEEEALRWAAEHGALLPLNSLSGSFGADEESALLAYAQSHSAVEFLLTDSRYGPDKLARTVAAFREGVTYDEAFQAGLGATVDEIDQQWLASLPYEIVPDRETVAASALDLVVWIAASVALLLFSAGGLLTAIILVRRRRPTHAGVTHPHPPGANL